MSSYLGDIALGDTIDLKFTTVGTNGAPTALAGTPAVVAYVGNSTTEITAGITLTTDFDARTGLNNVRVVASSGNGFAAGTNVDLVISAGTVGGTSVVGYKVGGFSISNRATNLDKVVMTNGAQKLAVHASGTLSGTHSATTADLGTNAPAGDVSGMTLYVPTRNFSRLIDSYNAGTGVATFGTTAVTLTNGDEWLILPTPKPSTANLIPANALQMNNAPIYGDGTSGNKWRGGA